MATVRLLRGLLFAACLPALARAQCGTPQACASVGFGEYNTDWRLTGSPKVSQLTCASWSAMSGLGANYNYYLLTSHCYVRDCASGFNSGNVNVISGFAFMCKRFSTCSKAFPPKLLGKCPQGSQPVANGANMACCCTAVPYALVDSKLIFQGCLKTNPWIPN